MRISDWSSDVCSSDPLRWPTSEAASGSRPSIPRQRMTGMADFWRRLRQRKLVQWALAYAAGAFALLQGVDIVAQQFGWPEGLQRGITLALVLGFFVTLVLAWIGRASCRARVGKYG